MKPSLTHISGLETLQVIGNDPSVGIIFFHGYGANMNDLFPLWEMWNKEKCNWYFPNGLLPLPMGYYEGRSWFSIDAAELEKAMREGRHRELHNFIPPELNDTLKALEDFIVTLSKKHKKLILGGFSQGAMCASHLAMKVNLNIDGLILLSGGLLAQEKFPKAAKAVPFYQSHGSQDPVLSVEGAKALEQKLHSLNFKGKLHLFNGGHEIPYSVINEVKSFLHSLID